jgi:phosphoesterase RecJ-like protein
MKIHNIDPGWIHKKIKHSLTDCKKPLILSHVRPDGDAIGSVIGFTLVLQALGKNPQPVLLDGLPRKFRFLMGANFIKNEIKEEYDLVIALDCADRKRIGSPIDQLKIQINIDHHITNELFGEINLVLPEQPSTTAILAQHLPHWGFSINSDAANALLMGMVTDTIGFSTSNVKSDFLYLAASLMEKGADLAHVYHHALTAQSLPASVIWGNALARIKSENNLAWTTITLEDRANAKYKGKDDADLTNHLSLLEDIDIAVLFNEQKDETVKVSWRSNAKFDVSRIALQFGGGGHPPAAGAEITGDLESVMKDVLGETKRAMMGK